VIQTRRSDLRAEVLLLLCVFIWGANYSVSKFGIQRLDPLVYNALRYLVGTVFLQIVLSTGTRRVMVSPGDRGPLIRAGFLANVLNQIAFILGLSLTSAGNAAILLATAPVLTVLLNSRIHKAAIPGIVWLGTAMSLTGVVLIIVGSGRKVEIGSTALLGDILCLVAAFLWAFNTNLQKPLVGKYPPVQVAASMVTVGAIGLTIAAVPVLPGLSWDHADWPLVAAVVWSGIFSIGLGNIIWSTGVKRLGPASTANFGNLMPVVAFLISLFVLEEAFDVLQIVGAAVTVTGVWLARAPSSAPSQKGDGDGF
jgi:drug/metabolite transporter (DMT)-like permease